jgi:D-proline reductase (dithiol) PrdB
VGVIVAIEDREFRIDGYKFLPKSMLGEFKAFPYQAEEVVVAAPTIPLGQAKVALLTSGGLYLKGRQPPFDLERERSDPYWGDPSYRVIPRDTTQGEISVAHLHLNPDDILTDFNVALPLRAFAEFEGEGKIGALARDNYSFMGYQGRSTDAWRNIYGPDLVKRLRADDVSLVILAPS